MVTMQLRSMTTFSLWISWGPSREVGMSRFVRTIFATSGFILLMTACGTVETLPVRVVSLEENLPALSEAAQAWRPDSYLANASLALLDEQAEPLLLQAVFLSPSEQSQGLSVVLMEGGTINAEVVPHTVPVIQVEPIADDDWRLDSTEALERGLDEEGRRYIEEHSTWDCSFLVLERGGREPGSPRVSQPSDGQPCAAGRSSEGHGRRTYCQFPC